MVFRPCIDIHNGKIKQIVGSSLLDEGNQAKENFVAEQDGAFFANFFKKDEIKGGHIILLNYKDSEFYEETKKQAKLALSTYPGGFQIGGGVNPENAKEFLEAGASHVIVTSYVFQNGNINYENLRKMIHVVGKRRLVLDLSCKKQGDGYYIVTDRWQNITREKLSVPLLEELSVYCDEFLVHAVDVEGKNNGVEKELLPLLGGWGKIPVTYAGGVHSFEDLDLVKRLGCKKVDVTIGSALDLYGGKMNYQEVLSYMRES